MESSQNSTAIQREKWLIEANELATQWLKLVPEDQHTMGNLLRVGLIFLMNVLPQISPLLKRPFAAFAANLIDIDTESDAILPESGERDQSSAPDSSLIEGTENDRTQDRGPTEAGISPT